MYYFYKNNVSIPLLNRTDLKKNIQREVLSGSSRNLRVVFCQYNSVISRVVSSMKQGEQMPPTPEFLSLATALAVIYIFGKRSKASYVENTNWPN